MRRTLEERLRLRQRNGDICHAADKPKQIDGHIKEDLCEIMGYERFHGAFFFLRDAKQGEGREARKGKISEPSNPASLAC